MRAHPITGEEILRPVQRMQEVAKILRHHHEKWDGTGYPDQLRGDAIPLGARIMAVIDAYSAIVDKRPLPLAAPGQYFRLEAEWVDVHGRVSSIQGAS